MKTALRIVALTAMLFSLAFASQASADTLGNTLANHLCGGSSQTYRLTMSERAQWTGLAVNGAYSTTSGSTTTSHYFYKAANNDDAATCKKSVKSSSGTTCQQWRVTRNVSVLTKSTSADRCD